MADYFTLLRDRVTLKYGSIDRIVLQAYVPKLQTVGQVCAFLRWQRRFPIPSSAAFGKIGDAYVEAIYCYAKAHNIPVVRFEKGENKEKTARPYKIRQLLATVRAVCCMWAKHNSRYPE